MDLCANTDEAKKGWQKYEGNVHPTTDNKGCVCLEEFVSVGANTGVFRARWITSEGCASLGKKANCKALITPSQVVAVKMACSLEKHPNLAVEGKASSEFAEYLPEAIKGVDYLNPFPRLFERGVGPGRRNFLVMEYVEGWDLPALLDQLPEGRLPEPLGLYVLWVVLAALDAASRAGYINKDLQFKNIRWLERLHLPQKVEILPPEEAATSLSQAEKAFLRWWPRRDGEDPPGKAIILRMLDWNSLETLEQIGVDKAKDWISKQLALVGRWGVRILTGVTLEDDLAWPPTRLAEYIGPAWENLSAGTQQLLVEMLAGRSPKGKAAPQALTDAFEALTLLLEYWTKDEAALKEELSSLERHLRAIREGERADWPTYLWDLWKQQAARSIARARGSEGLGEKEEGFSWLPPAFQAVQNLITAKKDGKAAREKLRELLRKPPWDQEITLRRWEALLETASATGDRWDERFQQAGEALLQLARDLDSLAVLREQIQALQQEARSTSSQALQNLADECDLLWKWREVQDKLKNISPSDKRATDELKVLEKEVGDLQEKIEKIKWKELYENWLPLVGLSSLSQLKDYIQRIKQVQRQREIVFQQLNQKGCSSSLTQALRTALRKLDQALQEVSEAWRDAWREIATQANLTDNKCRALWEEMARTLHTLPEDVRRDLVAQIRERKAIEGLKALLDPNAEEKTLEDFQRQWEFLDGAQKLRLLPYLQLTWVMARMSGERKRNVREFLNREYRKLKENLQGKAPETAPDFIAWLSQKTEEREALLKELLNAWEKERAEWHQKIEEVSKAFEKLKSQVDKLAQQQQQIEKSVEKLPSELNAKLNTIQKDITNEVQIFLETLQSAWQQREREQRNAMLQDIRSLINEVVQNLVTTPELEANPEVRKSLQNQVRWARKNLTAARGEENENTTKAYADILQAVEYILRALGSRSTQTQQDAARKAREILARYYKDGHGEPVRGPEASETNQDEASQAEQRVANIPPAEVHNWAKKLHDFMERRQKAETRAPIWKRKRGIAVVAVGVLLLIIGAVGTFVGSSIRNGGVMPDEDKGAAVSSPTSSVVTPSPSIPEGQTAGPAPGSPSEEAGLRLPGLSADDEEGQEPGPSNPEPLPSPTSTPPPTPTPTPTPIFLDIAIPQGDTNALHHPWFLDIPVEQVQVEGKTVRIAWFAFPRIEIPLANCTKPFMNEDETDGYPYLPQEAMRVKCPDVSAEDLFLTVQVQEPGTNHWWTLAGEARGLEPEQGDATTTSEPLRVRWHPYWYLEEPTTSPRLALVLYKATNQQDQDGAARQEGPPSGDAPRQDEALERPAWLSAEFNDELRFRVVLVAAEQPAQARAVLLAGTWYRCAPPAEPEAAWFPTWPAPSPTPPPSSTDSGEPSFDLADELLPLSKVKKSEWLQAAPQTAYRPCCMINIEGYNFVYVLVPRPGERWTLWPQFVNAGMLHPDLYYMFQNALYEACTPK